MGERVVGVNPNWKIIDGGGNESANLSEGAVEAGKRFVDEVMEKIEDTAILEVIEGGSSGVESHDTETIVEFFGPRRLPKITSVKKETNPSPKRHFNILSFFNRGNK